MRTLTGSVIVIAGLVASGCMPLEQAPLVYASKQQMGVGVTAGAPESPGLDVNIGYKGLDAAYVPVAVAKRCPADGSCRKTNYDINVVTGKNSISGQASLDEKRANLLDDKIAAADKEIAGNAGAITLAKQQLASIATLEAKQQQLDGLNAVDPATGVARTLTPEEEALKPKLVSEIAALTALRGKASDLDASVKALEARNKFVADERQTNLALLEKVLASTRQQTGDDKADAFSVYGSFNGKANGGRDGAALSLGKVFSTGIAAQNVSQGIRISARHAAVANCLSTVAALVDDALPADKPRVRDSGIAACGSVSPREE